MFAGKTLIKKTYKVHHRTLQVVYNDFRKSNDEMLDMDKYLSIHQRHLRYLATEVFKSINTFKSITHVVLFQGKTNAL